MVAKARPWRLTDSALRRKAPNVLTVENWVIMPMSADNPRNPTNSSGVRCGRCKLLLKRLLYSPRHETLPQDPTPFPKGVLLSNRSQEENKFAPCSPNFHKKIRIFS